MKCIIICFCLLIPALAQAHVGNEKRMRSYEIDSVKNNILLQQGNAKIVFSVKEPKGYSLQKGTLVFQSDTLPVIVEQINNAQFSISVPHGEFCLLIRPPYCEAISIDKKTWHDGTTTYISLFLEPSVIVLPEIRFEYDKPVIYCYSLSEQKTEIQLPENLHLRFTYPTYAQSWSFIAHPNGTISIKDKDYRYLFWDATMNELPFGFTTKVGYLISQNELITFFEESLSALGLNNQEQQDFITYWAPQMLAYEKVFIHFSTTDYNHQIPLSIIPQPDWIQRIFMIWTDGKHINEVPEPQNLTSPLRHGFAVLEWGGTKIPDFYFHPN